MRGGLLTNNESVVVAPASIPALPIVSAGGGLYAVPQLISSFTCSKDQDSFVAEVVLNVRGQTSQIRTDGAGGSDCFPYVTSVLDLSVWGTVGQFDGATQYCESSRNIGWVLEYGYQGVKRKLTFDARDYRLYLGRVDFVQVSMVWWAALITPLGAQALIASAAIMEASGGSYDEPLCTAAFLSEGPIDGKLYVPQGAQWFTPSFYYPAATDFWGATLPSAKFSGDLPTPILIDPANSAYLPAFPRYPIRPNLGYIRCETDGTEADLYLGGIFYLGT